MKNIEEYLLMRIDKITKLRETLTYKQNPDKFVKLGTKLTVYHEVLEYNRQLENRTELSEDFIELLKIKNNDHNYSKNL